MSQKSGSKKQAFTPCTLKELCPEDKQKVAQLVKQVVELGKENQQLKAAAATAATTEDKLRQIQDCNKEAVKENCSLKNKLGQAITVLRMYHHKVQGLDAALRALQHSAPADASADTPDQQQATQQQQVGQEPLPLPAPAAAGQGSPVKQPASAGIEQATASQANAPSATAASRSPGQGLAPDQTATAVASPAATPTQTPLAGSIQQQQCLCSKLLCGGLPGLSAIPSLSAFSSNLNVGLPVQQLQPWQLQGLFAEQLVSNPRTVLHFDPTIGSRGAYLVQELPDQQLPLLPGSAAAASSPAAAAAAAVSAGNAPSAPVSPGRVLAQQLSPQHQPTGGDSGLAGQSLQQTRREISAGGAATAAAAAAASSALAAVKAAAAVCAATSWQSDLSSCSISSPGQQQGVNMFGGFPDAAQHPTVHSRAASRQDGDPLGMNSCGTAVRASQDAAGLPAAVEEVPIVDMAEAPVHVLVQNEKSASSLHQAHARVTLAGGMGDGAASPEPPAPAATAAAAAWAGSSGMVMQQPLMPQQQQHQGEPGLWDIDSRQPGVWQQPADQQCFAQLPAHQQQQQHHNGMGPPMHSCMANSMSPASAAQQQQHWQQQQQAYQQVGAWDSNDARHAGHMVGAGQAVHAAAPCGDRTNTNWACGHGAPARGKRQVPPPPHAAAGGYQHGPEYPLAGQHRYNSSNSKRWGQQEQQQGQHGAVEDGFGTQELLLKFDESLVDILAEVERLEQQQQARHQQPPPSQQQRQQQRTRPHQEQRQPRPQQRLQQLGPEEVAPARLSGPAGAAAGALARMSPSQQLYLDQKQAQLQQRIQQLQQEDMHFSSGAYPVGLPPGHRPGVRQQLPASAVWGYSESHDFDADDVSDILNHLD